MATLGSLKYSKGTQCATVKIGQFADRLPMSMSKAKTRILTEPHIGSGPVVEVLS